MTLTNTELCMIEQLCYLDEDVASAAGIPDFVGFADGTRRIEKTIGEILSVFDEDALEALRAAGIEELGGSWASAAEWAAIIEYLQSNERISSLVLTDTLVNSEGTIALCLAESTDSDSAIVAFKGTSGDEEWSDNAKGFTASDTDNQIQALDFIERLSYSDITVTGHSKGGNKAMYVAILSDKVTRCVAFDGQGFSQEFLDKYWAEIQQCGGIITSYSVSTDYVHALLFAIPNSNQVYCEGYGINSVGQHHSPNSFFEMNDDGTLILDASGNPKFTIVSEDESITMLHNFTIFVLNNASEEDKATIVNYLSELLPKLFSDEAIPKEEKIQYILSDTDALALILAYLVSYMDVYNLDSEEIDQLLEALGLDSLDEIFTLEILGVKIVGLSGILNYCKRQLTDGDSDWITAIVFHSLVGGLTDIDIDVIDLWSKVNIKVKEINVSAGTLAITGKTGAIRDFSLNTYNTLMDAISKIENMSFSSLSSWSGYSSEEWYSSLMVPAAMKGFSAYFDKVASANAECKAKIEEVFSNVAEIDANAGNRIRQSAAVLKTIAKNLSDCANSIG